MANHDWSKFHLRIPIKAHPRKIFDALTTPSGLESWFLKKAIFHSSDGKVRNNTERIAVGDTYEWYWHGWSDEVAEKGVIFKLINEENLQFKFGNAGKVTFTLKEEEGENLLILEQTEIPTDENSRINYYLGCSKGWLFYLTNLKSILEGGLDLRNKKVELKDVITA
jgi:Uncharacterized conserved protein